MPSLAAPAQHVRTDPQTIVLRTPHASRCNHWARILLATRPSGSCKNRRLLRGVPERGPFVGAAAAPSPARPRKEPPTNQRPWRPGGASLLTAALPGDLPGPAPADPTIYSRGSTRQPHKQGQLAATRVPGSDAQARGDGPENGWAAGATGCPLWTLRPALGQLGCRGGGGSPGDSRTPHNRRKGSGVLPSLQWGVQCLPNLGVPRAPGHPAGSQGHAVRSLAWLRRPCCGR